MHIPSVFCEENFDSIIDFIAAKPLATIIAQTSKGIEACHIPLFFHEECSNPNGQKLYLRILGHWKMRLLLISMLCAEVLLVLDSL